MGASVIDEVASAIGSIRFETVVDAWQESDHVGMQPILNAFLERNLVRAGWASQVPVFESDKGTGKGLWTMDFRKEFQAYPDQRIGLEVMFNHAEAMVWTMSRLDLANEAENVKPQARIDAGVMVVASDRLKRYAIRKRRDGVWITDGKTKRPREFTIDSAVGTYERLRTIVPKVRNFVKVPLLVCALEPEEGGMDDDLELITLDSDRVMVEGEWQGVKVPWSQIRRTI